MPVISWRVKVFCEGMIKRTPSFINSDEPKLGCFACLYKQPVPPTDSTRLIALTLWCFSSNPAFTVVAWPPPSSALAIYRRPRDLCIRQHPLQQPLLTVLCEAKLNQMCASSLIFTTPLHFASVSMLVWGI